MDCTLEREKHSFKYLQYKLRRNENLLTIKPNKLEKIQKNKTRKVGGRN